MNTELEKKRGRVPANFEVLVLASPTRILSRLASTDEVQVIEEMPPADEPRERFLLRRNEKGFSLIKAPNQVRNPVDEISNELQNLRLDGTIQELEDGVSKICLSFRWKPSRTAYISLWPLSVLAVTFWFIYGMIGLSGVLVGFAVLHWPRDVRDRRLELASKLSDAIGQHIISAGKTGPFR